uniref:G-protein coupled receptors family 1 profile domain-containing protein n=1 Tax=Ficedula albicollis TaxID=59894 RepID=A0A803VB48_FICAL
MREIFRCTGPLQFQKKNPKCIYPLTLAHICKVLYVREQTFIFFCKYSRVFKVVMVQENATHIPEFILLGFPATPELQALLFVTFLAVYLLTVTENLVIMVLIVTSPQLHRPMYFFLGHLAFLEACYISVTVPKLHRACRQLATGSWLLGFLTALLKVFFISQLSFCGPRVINHFFCDVSPLLNLSCSQRRRAEIVDFISALLVLLIPLSVIIISYTCIISTVLLIPKAQNRRKAFSTCASHLAVVIIFFSATLFMYARPRSIRSWDLNKLVSIIYIIITPMLNPFIYCLRNQEIKDTLLKVFCSRAALS